MLCASTRLIFVLLAVNPASTGLSKIFNRRFQFLRLAAEPAYIGLPTSSRGAAPDFKTGPVYDSILFPTSNISSPYAHQLSRPADREASCKARKSSGRVGFSTFPSSQLPLFLAGIVRSWLIYHHWIIITERIFYLAVVVVLN